MTRILITGSRDWDNVNAVKGTLGMVQNLVEGPSEAYPDGDEPFVILHGGCPTGADKIAADIIAAPNRITGEPPYKPKWDQYGRFAGPLRNQAMIDTRPDFVLGFLNPCRKGPDCVRYRHEGEHWSHGAQDCADRAIKTGITTLLTFGR